MKLREVSCVSRGTKGTTYCGPTAISAMTGKDVQRVIKDILNRRRKRLKAAVSPKGYREEMKARSSRFRQVRGMYTHELMAIVEKYGYRLVGLRKDSYRRKTLHDWHFDERIYAREAIYLVVVHHHFVAVQGWNCCDAMSTKGKVLPIGKYARPKSIVTDAFRLERAPRRPSGSSSA